MAFRIKIPDIMPVLSHGNHEAPSQGACFMEYTALLAGEPFTDRPNCVDRELSSAMMWINDILPDVDRHLLVPFLGRGIGLVYPRHPRPISKALAAQLDSRLRAAVTNKYNERVMRWESKALGFRTDEVLPRLMGLLPEAPQVETGQLPDLSNVVTMWFAGWSRATGNKLLPTEDGRHDSTGCDYPERCTHHLDPGHRAAVDMTLRVADALHTAYEAAMEDRGWHVKREPACDLPDVMRTVRQRE